MNGLINEQSNELLQKENCFDVIRYFFTVSVIIVHFCELNDIEICWFVSSSTSVKSFFIMSGFLVFYSYIRTHNINIYIKKRCRRILPPYITVVILFTIAGMFLTEYSWIDYLTSKDTYKYLLANLSFLNFIQPTLPGVFESNPIHAVNGSLWTMKVEVMFYVSVPFILYFMTKCRKLFVIMAIFLVALLYDYGFTFLYEQTQNELYLLIRKQIGSQLIYFYSGTFILLYFDRFIKYLRYFFLTAIIVYAYQGDFILLDALKPLAFATLLIGVAYNLKFLNFLRKYDNVSYGMYLYHYPIIQTIIYYKVPQYNIYLAFLLALSLTVFVSILSWKFIEKPIITQTYKRKRIKNKSN